MPEASPDRITEEELVERAGFDREHLRRLADLRILHRADDGTYPRREIVRARAVADLEALGAEPEGDRRSARERPPLAGLPRERGSGFPRSERTFVQVADDLGISFATLERFYVAYGLPRPMPDEHIREEDLEEIGRPPVLLEAGVDLEVVLRFARVWGDSARRVAQYLIHHFHTAVEEPFRRQGLGDNQAFEAALRQVGLKLGRSGEDMLGWLFRRHSETFMREHHYQHAKVALESAGVYERRERHLGAAAFADLTGYTRLTEEAGDDAAARVALSLADLVSEIAAHRRGTVVKMLGDGVHFHFADPRDAVLASLDIVEAVGPRGLPPAHVGVEAGPMIYDEGDYFGRTVNVAARIASQAGADQVFVGEGFAELVPPDGFRLRELGAFELKGIAKPVTLFEAERDG